MSKQTIFGMDMTQVSSLIRVMEYHNINTAEELDAILSDNATVLRIETLEAKVRVLTAKVNRAQEVLK